ncbi:MAG: hypothetical protein ACMVY4_01945 [Minwuia sp.]|uniref:hypothetical protein n=1 Tax=Minwuia sp. TaxID=2493630 RepID=UPI003A8C1611
MDLRPPSRVMNLERMGAAFPTRLSFMRSLVRRMARERWRFEIVRFDIDERGVGTAVLAAHTPERTYSVLVFGHDLPPEQRTDRVIAEAWDATFNLIDGLPSEADIERLSRNTPTQEAGRYSPKELVLARANRSVRLFGHVVDSLAAGRQPEIDPVVEVGYLMRTTAVYGNGKFGIADRGRIADLPETMGAFQAEMLAVWLFRWFTLEMVQHLARLKGGASAASLDPAIARYLGIGNATGLGMAPFLVSHPQLIDRWVTTRETALARVRHQPTADPEAARTFMRLLDRAEQHVADWKVDDPGQMRRIEDLAADLRALRPLAGHMLPDEPAPWDRMCRHAMLALSTEGQELLVTLLIECHGDLVDDLADAMFTAGDEPLDAAMNCGRLLDLVKTNYAWALAFDFDDPAESARYWYYSEEKLEPRLGPRDDFATPAREMPLATARDVAGLAHDLERADPDRPLGMFLLDHPAHRSAALRVQLNARHMYSEIRANLIAEGVRPIDILRFKLAFFGACRFDPKSDLWTRIGMYNGAPLPDDFAGDWDEHWSLPVRPGVAA